MIEKTLAGMSAQGESYYFQLYPLSLSIVGQESIPPAAGTTYRFTVLKGQQKFDENKLPIEANFKRVNGVDAMVIPKCPLNFYVPSFNKARKTEFLYKMYQTEKDEEYDIGEYVINVEPYITEYKENRTVRFQHKSFFSDDYELQFQIYIEKSRFALEKVVKDYKVERGLKSPLKERKEPSVNSSAKRGLTTPQVAKSAINETPSKDEPEKPENNNDEKEREQVRTEIESENPKQSRQSREESVYSNMRDSRSSNRGIEKKEEEPRNVKAAQSEIRQVNQSGKKSGSAIKPTEEAAFEERNSRHFKNNTEQSSVKNERYSQSGASQKKVPVVQVSMKQLSKLDTPAEVRLDESQRLPTGPSAIEAPAPRPASKSGTSTKDKIVLIAFFLAAAFIMYWAMHPNKKV